MPKKGAIYSVDEPDSQVKKDDSSKMTDNPKKSKSGVKESTNKSNDDIILYFSGRSLPMISSEPNYVLALHAVTSNKDEGPIPIGCTNVGYGSRDPNWDVGLRVPRNTIFLRTMVYHWNSTTLNPDTFGISDLDRAMLCGQTEIYISDIRNADGNQLAKSINKNHTFKLKKSRIIVRLNKRVMTRKTVPLTVDSKSLLLKAKDELADQRSFTLFLAIATSFVLLDQVIISWKPEGTYFLLQLYVLGGSTICWFISIVLSYINMPSVMLDPEDPDLQSATVVETNRKIISALGGEVFFEMFFLAVGWVCLFFYEGLSPFRSFRILRFMWYFELIELDEEDFFFFLIQACRHCTKFLSQIGNELFWASRSRGGSVVIALFLYVCYITGVVFWIQTAPINLTGTSSEFACDRIDHCMFTMMRLAFYDAEGLDLIRNLMDTRKHQFLVILLVLFLFISSFILLNGLIGIFGDIFSNRSDSKKGNGGDKSAASKGAIEAIVASNNAQRNETNLLLKQLNERSERSNAEVVALLAKLSEDMVIAINRLGNHSGHHDASHGAGAAGEGHTAITRTTVFID